MGFIRITEVGLSLVPGGNQTVTISHRLASDPDITGSYTVDANNVAVQPNGVLISAYDITGLTDGVNYVVKIVNNCGGAGSQQQYNLPATPTTTVLVPTTTAGVTTTGAPTTTQAPLPAVNTFNGFSTVCDYNGFPIVRYIKAGSPRKIYDDDQGLTETTTNCFVDLPAEFVTKWWNAASHALVEADSSPLVLQYPVATNNLIGRQVTQTGGGVVSSSRGWRMTNGVEYKLTLEITGVTNADMVWNPQVRTVSPDLTNLTSGAGGPFAAVVGVYEFIFTANSCQTATVDLLIVNNLSETGVITFNSKIEPN